jgi:two-component system, NarL family, sensor histidine kinase FusK
MLTSIKEQQWLRQIAVFVVYGVVYAWLRPYASSVWAITCGLRLACLLLLPYRYWPALALAEIGPLVYQNLESLDSFGLAWTITNSIPGILFAMPVVWWCKQRRGLFPSKRLVNVNALFVCVLLASLAWTADTFLSLAMVVQPPATPQPYAFRPLDMVQLSLGRYLGVITLVPLALLFKLRSPMPLSSRLHAWMTSRLVLETILLLIPSLAALVWLDQRVSADAQQVIRMSMFLLAAWLTMKHGWRAAAVSIAAVITCIFLYIKETYNAVGLVGTEAFSAFAATSLFALGVYVTAQNAAEEQERLHAKVALKLAQQGLYLCEVRMRQAAQALEQIGGTLQLTQTRLLNRFKHMLAVTEGQNYYRQAAATQHQMYRLAESLHPTAWRERGLPAALRETIGRALDEARLGYRFNMKGRGLSQLSPGVHSAIYRLACEAVVHLCEHQPCTTVALSLRGGLTNGQRWAVLRIEGWIDQDDMDEPIHKKSEIQQLAFKLGTMGLGIAAMRDHVRLYDGELHIRTIQGKYQVTALLHDASQPAKDDSHAAPALELYIR